MKLRAALFVLLLLGGCRTRLLDVDGGGLVDVPVDLSPPRDLSLVDLSRADLAVRTDGGARDAGLLLDLAPSPNTCRQVPNGASGCTLLGGSPEGPSGCILSSTCTRGTARVVCDGRSCSCESTGQVCATFPQGSACSGAPGGRAAWDRCDFP